jgi:GAF domain-containing protein
VTSISFLIWRNVALDREGARCRTQRAAEIQHLIQRQLTILHRISGPGTRHGIRREAQLINRIREMLAFLVIKCRRGTREADPHLSRVPPKLGGALWAASRLAATTDP